jgi:hypothetical protein
MTPDPADVEVLVGGDVSKGEHHATAVDAAGQTLLSRTVANDQAALEALLDAAGEHGTPALVIDQPGSIAALALAVARQHDVAVASRPGVGDAPRRRPVSRPGHHRQARGRYVLADTARVPDSRIAWLEVTDYCNLPE